MPDDQRPDHNPDDSAKRSDQTDHRKATPSQAKEGASRMVNPLLVGVGASAGGLEPLFSFVEALKPESPCAYFIVQHQTLNTGQALLSSLLEKRATLRVVLAEEGMAVEPGVIYVAPPDQRLAVEGATVRLTERESLEARDRSTMGVDHLLRSLATAGKERSVAVILSGSGTDGALGAKAVKEQGGFVIVQDPETAEHQDMPRAVLTSGVVDVALQPADMAMRVAEYALSLDKRRMNTDGAPFFDPNMRKELLRMVQRKVGHNFAVYKDNTVNRRLQRRMDFHRFESPEEYLDFLRADPEEAKALFRDMLISVTNFFRDHHCFERLREHLVTQLAQSRRDVGGEIRAWVPGCATGEEAYSLAIILREVMDQTALDCDVTIYATDLDADAIVKARRGVYPQNIEADVSAERLKHCFIQQEDGQYRLKQHIRDMLVFAEQNLLQDPPFSNVDVILCRNLLMYFKPEAQREALAQFLYALKSGGALMVGSSEGVSQLEQHFAEVDKQCRIFSSLGGDERQRVRSPRGSYVAALDDDQRAAMRSNRDAPSKAAEDETRCGAGAMERVLLNICTPPSIIMTRQGDIRFFHGRTGKLLEPSQGVSENNALRMAREGLRTPLATLVSECAATDEPHTRRGVRVKTNGEEAVFDVTVRPVRLHQQRRRLFTATFEERDPKDMTELSNGEDEGGYSEMARKRIAALEAEVQECRESLRAVIDDYEAANEELRSSNEEMESTNEELKSTNEELETAKEELQSINEEQSTLNAELHAKNEELQRISSDMDNLLVSTEIATLFLDQELAIKRFTPAMREIMRLRDADVGRPVTDIAMRLEYEELVEDARRVMESLEPRVKELQGEDDAWLQMRIRPYKTVENRIDGVVITFNDITLLKRSERTAQNAQRFAEHTLEFVSEPLAVLDADFTLHSVNKAFLALFGLERRDALGRRLPRVLADLVDRDALERCLEDLAATEHDGGFQADAELRNITLPAPGLPDGGGALQLNLRFTPYPEVQAEQRILLAVSRVTRE